MICKCIKLCIHFHFQWKWQCPSFNSDTKWYVALFQLPANTSPRLCFLGKNLTSTLQKKMTLLSLHCSPIALINYRLYTSSLFFSFKSFNNLEIDNWMIRQPGQTHPNYGIAACVAVTFDRAVRSGNIKSGFKKCGIFLFVANKFLPMITL